MVDVDGDGRPDTAWIIADPEGTVRVGVVTAAGGGAMRTWDSASPVARAFLVVDINPESPPLFLADDGRTVELWAFVDCAIADVLNVQGEPYTFSLGFSDVGTGVGCAVVNGTEQLVGLDVATQTDTSVDWTSTVVMVTGTEARNGTITSGTFEIPVDNAAIDLLHTVACRDKTIRDDGISTEA